MCSPLACDFTHRGRAGAAHAVPAKGWETRRGCTEGDRFQVLTEQAHMQTGQCNRDVCAVLCFAHLLFSSLVSALEAFDIRGHKIPKSSAAQHWERCSPSAFSRWALASIFEAGADIKCILPHKSLTTCAAKQCLAVVTAADTRFPLCRLGCQRQKGS